jgi:hypothetical protein
MAKNKKWNKVIARIQALEKALAGLLSKKPSTGTKRKKAKKTPAKTKPKAKAAPKQKALAKRPARKRTNKKAPVSAPRKTKTRKSLRVVVAENAPVPFQAPLLSL